MPALVVFAVENKQESPCLFSSVPSLEKYLNGCLETGSQILAQKHLGTFLTSISYKAETVGFWQFRKPQSKAAWALKNKIIIVITILLELVWRAGR